MIDSHCHLDCDLFDGDRAAVLERAAARGVTDIVVPAVGEASWEPILRLRAVAAPRCHVALGLHPVSLPETRDDEGALRRLEGRLDEVVAVGECGLDETIDLTAAPWERQESVLRRQLALARARQLPVILHARGREAYRRLAELLRSDGLPSGGVLHSYGGGALLVPELLSLPLAFGFAGPATYPNARKVRAAIMAVPKDRLLAETDAPDQTPEPYRPGRSEPAYVHEVVAGLAAAHELPHAAMAALTTGNARRWLRLPER